MILAVLYGSQSLLILNGMDSTGATLSDINVFDTMGQQWVNQFLTFENYPSTSNNNNNITVINSGLDYDPTDSAMAGGLGAGLFVVKIFFILFYYHYHYYFVVEEKIYLCIYVFYIYIFQFISLVGFALYKYVEKHTSRHQENENIISYDNKSSAQYNDTNNNYNHQASSPHINNNGYTSPSTTQYHENGNNNYNNYQPPSSPSSPHVDNRPLPPTPIMTMPTGPENYSSSSQIFYQQDVPYPQQQQINNNYHYGAKN